MAIRAFDLMIGHVILVHQLRGIFGAQEHRIVMTLDTLPFRDMAVSFDHVEMALFAGHTSFDIFPMIETPAFDIDVALRLKVAGGTTPNGTRNALLFRFGACFKIVTDETVRLVNSEVHSLDDLRVAGGTSQLHSPPQLAQMLPMGEGNILIDHISLEILDLMTPLLQAACIANLRMWHGRLLPGDEIGQRNLSIDPFPFHVIEKTRCVVALGARHVAMAGGLPRIHIPTHLVTEATECRRLRKSEKTHEDNNKGDHAEEQKDLNPFDVFLGSSPRLSKEIDPKGFN